MTKTAYAPSETIETLANRLRGYERRYNNVPETGIRVSGVFIRPASPQDEGTVATFGQFLRDAAESGLMDTLKAEYRP